MSGMRKRVARVVATQLRPVDGQVRATLVLTSDSSTVFEVAETETDALWLAGVLDACGVEAWEQLAGRTVYVLRRTADGPVVGLEHLATEPGGRFMFPDVDTAEEES